MKRAVAILLFVFLFFVGLRLAQNKMLWNDELYSQVYSIEKISYGEIFAGKITEGNNCPLFYVLQKALCDVSGYKLPFDWKKEWAVAHPQAQIILRLWPILFMSLALAAIFYVFSVEYSYIAAIFAFLTALLTETVWGYWAEARPYALWFSLSAFQALYLLRFIKNENARGRFWLFLGVIHVLLSLTAVFGTVQAFLGSLLLFVFYEKKLSRFILLLFVPLLIGFFYFFNAQHYIFGLPNPWSSLIFENLSLDRLFFLFVFGALPILFKHNDHKIINRFGLFFILMLAACLGIMWCLTWTGQEGWVPFTVSSKYFIFLAPVGAIATAVFLLEGFKMSNFNRQAVVVMMAIVLALSGYFVLIKNNNLLRDNPIFVNLKEQQAKVKSKAMMATINHYRPDLSLWKSFLKDQQPVDERFLKDNVEYYEMIINYAPNVAETYHVLGLCRFMLGDHKKAIEAQEKAVVLEPRFFWGWYNLGVMFYKVGRFAESAKAFRNALGTPPQAAGRIISSSRIYEEIIRGSGTGKVITTQRLAAGYLDAARLMDASILRLKGQPVGFDDKQLGLKLF